MRAFHLKFYAPCCPCFCNNIKENRIFDTNPGFTVFENYSKCHISIFEFGYFPPIFVLLNVTCNTVYKNSPKLTILGFFNELLSTQNVNVARFARNVEWDFSMIFKHRANVDMLKVIWNWHRGIYWLCNDHLHRKFWELQCWKVYWQPII